MVKIFGFLLGLTLMFAVPFGAQAATLNLSIVINSQSSTSVTCPITTALTAPVAAGTVVCTLSVAPSTWSGALALSGTNAGLFAISNGASGTQLVVGTNAITTPGSYALTITSTP